MNPDRFCYTFSLALKMREAALSGGGKMGKANIWKGAVAGLVGGLVASYVMNEYQALVTKLTEGNKVP